MKIKYFFQYFIRQIQNTAIYDAKLKPYYGVGHNPPVKNIQIEFGRNTKVKKTNYYCKVKNRKKSILLKNRCFWERIKRWIPNSIPFQ